MSNNDWYDNSGWYEPLHPEKKTAKPRLERSRSGWTKARAIGAVVLVIIFIVATSLLFAQRSQQRAYSFYWGGSDNTPWSADGRDGTNKMPDSKEDFFDKYYTETDTDTAEINIPTVELESDFTLRLEAPGEQELTLNELYDACAPSIVAIYGYVDGQTGYYWGSGVVLSEDGLILTNTHVINNCDRAAVKLADNSEYEAKLVGADTISDIAILKIEASGLTAAHFGESSGLKTGDAVAAIGNPLGETFRMTMTNGIISAIDRGISYKGHDMTVLQTNTAINEGNSGGALFNMYGQVIGITNMKMISYYSSIEGIGFAIPSATASSVVDSLLKYGEVKGRPSIGITVGAIPDVAREEYGLPEGLYVSAVAENSDAARQGMKPGDVITEVNYQHVTTTDEVNAIKNTLEVGDLMIFTVWRDGETMEFEVMLMDNNAIYK